MNAASIDIAATAAGDGITSEVIRQMLRTALADRVGLVLHNETRTMRCAGE